jgi:hypothetical protein
MPSPLLGDALLITSVALPVGANTVTSAGIDLQTDANSQFLPNGELLVSAPALTVTQLPNTQTIQYSVVTSANANMSNPTVVDLNGMTQTGAGGAGAAASSFRFKPASNTQRYIAIRAVNSGSGDCSSASVTMQLVF